MSKPLELIRTIKYHSVSSTTNVFFFFFNTGDSWLKCVIKTVLFDRRSADHRIYVVKYLSGSSTKIHALIYLIPLVCCTCSSTDGPVCTCSCSVNLPREKLFIWTRFTKAWNGDLRARRLIWNCCSTQVAYFGVNIQSSEVSFYLRTIAPTIVRQHRPSSFVWCEKFPVESSWEKMRNCIAKSLLFVCGDQLPAWCVQKCRLRNSVFSDTGLLCSLYTKRNLRLLAAVLTLHASKCLVLCRVTFTPVVGLEELFHIDRGADGGLNSLNGDLL